MTALRLESLSVGLGGRTFCRDLSMSLDAGEILAVLGENGVGKSTLLLTVAGLLDPQSGSIRIDEQFLSRLSRRQIARRLGMLLQHDDIAFPFTVRETLAGGLFAWNRRLSAEREDEQVVSKVADLLWLTDKLDKAVQQLSGGERRRVAFGTLLVQDPDILLLDEPTNHLDVRHQMHCLNLVRRKVTEQGRLAVISTHDVNLAARFADRLLFLYGDGEWESGPSSDMLSEARLSRLYGLPLRPVQDGPRTVWLP